MRISCLFSVARRRALPQLSTDEPVRQRQDAERYDVRRRQDEERVHPSPDVARLWPDLVAVGDDELRRDAMAVRPADDELDGRKRAGDDPDGGDDDARTRLGDARSHRIVDDPVAVDADGDDRADGRRDGDALHVQDDRTHRRREDPVAEHRHRERERHAEDGHDEVGGGEVDQKPAVLAQSERENIIR